MSHVIHVAFLACAMRASLDEACGGAAAPRATPSAVANMAAPADEDDDGRFVEITVVIDPSRVPLEERKRALKLVVSSGFVAYSAAAAALAEVAFEPARPRGQPVVVRATPRARADLEVRRIRKRPTAGAMRRAAE